MKRRVVAFAPEARDDLIKLGDWITERAGAEVALNYIVSSTHVTILRFYYGGQNWAGP